MQDGKIVHAHHVSRAEFKACSEYDWKRGDSYSPFVERVTCTVCSTEGMPSYPKSQYEDRTRKANGEYILPYDMFCFGNPLYADCHMAGSCRRRDRSCSE